MQSKEIISDKKNTGEIFFLPKTLSNSKYLITFATKLKSRTSKMYALNIYFNESTPAGHPVESRGITPPLTFSLCETNVDHPQSNQTYFNLNTRPGQAARRIFLRRRNPRRPVRNPGKKTNLCFSSMRPQKCKTHLCFASMRSQKAKTHLCFASMRSQKVKTHLCFASMKPQKSETHPCFIQMRPQRTKTHLCFTSIKAQQAKTHLCFSSMKPQRSKTHLCFISMKARQGKTHPCFMSGEWSKQKTHLCFFRFNRDLQNSLFYNL